MALTTDEKRAIIAYRVEKSRQTMIEARDNADMKHWSLAAIVCIIHRLMDMKWQYLLWTLPSLPTTGDAWSSSTACWRHGGGRMNRGETDYSPNVHYDQVNKLFQKVMKDK